MNEPGSRAGHPSLRGEQSQTRSTRGPRQSSRPLTRLHWGVFIGIAALGALVHIWNFLHAGGLWRDEVSSVRLATYPALGEMWRALDVPVLFPALLRIWSGIGFGQSDLGLRLLGLFIGLGFLGALWWNARAMGYRIPYLSLGLLAASLAMVRWGDSLRAYGLGSLVMLLTVGQIWAFIQSPNRARFALASVAAVLSVNCLFQNAVLLAAVCGSASLVCLLRKQPRTAVLVLGVGLLAALSLLFYRSLLTQAGEGWEILRTGFQGRQVLYLFSIALDSPPYLGPLIWLALFATGVGAGVAALDKPNRLLRVTEADLPLFGGAAALIGAAGFFVFLFLAKLPTQPWYYLPLMTFVAACLEAALAHWFRRHPEKWIWAAGVLTCLALPFSLYQARERQTNIDIIASWLNKNAQTNDLIIVYPWYYGVSFDYYHKSPTPWTTLPALADHRAHRYDLLKQKLAAADPIHDVLDRAMSTLAAGNQIWVVGRLPEAQPGETAPPTLPPAPNGPEGWFDEPYTYVWGRQTHHFLQGRGVRLEEVKLDLPTAVNRYEDPVLFRAGSF